MEESGCAWKCGAFVFGQMDMLADGGWVFTVAKQIDYNFIQFSENR
jgi:hypothetical protein